MPFSSSMRKKSTRIIWLKLMINSIQFCVIKILKIVLRSSNIITAISGGLHIFDEKDHGKE